jgi:hypothetical protein
LKNSSQIFEALSISQGMNACVVIGGCIGWQLPEQTDEIAVWVDAIHLVALDGRVEIGTDLRTRSGVGKRPALSVMESFLLPKGRVVRGFVTRRSVYCRDRDLEQLGATQRQRSVRLFERVLSWRLAHRIDDMDQLLPHRWALAAT